ncbi:MAG TPA: ParA family protein [Sphingomonas sp.]|jgi:cellulose biosynthesis protein BcsQ|uniref:ParA family protein n=1 Tax=Sphingomonas sp. TaxID=28214 RepID=UPI002ED8DEEF
MATVAIYSLKGGVGKTTLAVNLAWASAVGSSRRTLLWDLDPQAAASWILYDDRPENRRRDRAQAVFSRDIAPAQLVRPTAYPGLDLLPADASLRGLDHLLHDLDKKKRLGRLIDGLDHDRVLLDCPPGLTETADQAMRAADLVVVPVTPSALSTRAYQEVLDHLRGRTPVLPVHSMVDRRRRLHAEALRAEPEWPIVAMASDAEAAAAARTPLGAFAPRSVAAQSFLGVWRAVERRLAG